MGSNEMDASAKESKTPAPQVYFCDNCLISVHFNAWRLDS